LILTGAKAVSFGEPPRTQGELNFALFGIPVRIQPFFWLVGVLLGPYHFGLSEVLVWMLAFLIGILGHELGHALMMRAYGFHPWITLYGLGGMASYDYSQAARAGRWTTLRQILISAAGPAAGFLLAAVVVAALMLSGHHVDHEFGAPFGLLVGTVDILGKRELTYFVNDLLRVTIVYGVFNLLPIYPMDGGKIAREVLVAISPRGGIRLSLMLSILVAVGLAAFIAIRYRDLFMAILFGYLAYANFAAMQLYSGRR
jgi:stage IV sporulation protein FB